MKHYFKQGILVLLMALAVGCGVKHRIEKNQPYFDRLTPAQQEKIKNKQTDIGFTPQMVYIAWGRPTQKSKSVRANLTRETWMYSYEGYDTEYQQVLVFNHHNGRYENQTITIRHPYLVMSKYVMFENGKEAEYGMPNMTFRAPWGEISASYCGAFSVNSPDGCGMLDSMFIPQLRRLSK